MAETKKQWKAWGIFTPRGALCELWVTRPDAEWDVSDRARLNGLGSHKIHPVLITLAQPKRKAKK